MDSLTLIKKVVCSAIQNGNINIQTINVTDLLTKLRLLELLQKEIQNNYRSFNSKLSNFVNILQTHFGMQISPQEVVQYLISNNGMSLLNNFHIIQATNPKASPLPIPKIEEENTEKFENKELKAKYLQALKSKNHKRHFQVYYVFKSKIKRMYRIDCMTRKINVNFYHYLRDNYHSLNINDEFLDFFRTNIRFTSREKFQQLNKKYPQFTDIYNSYLESSSFRKLVSIIKKKYDNEYQKLFYRHSINFLNLYLKEKDNVDSKSANGSRSRKRLRKVSINSKNQK